MKLKYNMTSMEIDGEYMAIPLGNEQEFKGILRMNGTTADILELLKKEVTEDTIVAALLREYDAEKEEIQSSVTKVLEILRKNGLLEE